MEIYTLFFGGIVFLIVLGAALALVLALLYLWLTRTRRQLWRVVLADDPVEIESARDLVSPREVPYLIRRYWRTADWPQKRALVDLLQDQSHPDLPALMLDFLRVPLEPGDEQTELAQAVALGFVDERYDQFMTYYNDRDRLAWDVRAVLGAHGLKSETVPQKPKPPGKFNRRVPSVGPPNPRLVQAIFDDDAYGVDQALADGADVNFLVPDGIYKGCSVLIYAALHGHFAIAQTLIEAGADVNARRPDLQGKAHENHGQTALWWAASHGNLPLAHELIRRGAHLNNSDHHGSTPLSVAASAGETEMARYLVAQGADIHTRLTTLIAGTPDGRKPFHLAVTNGHTGVVEVLLAAGADPDEYGGSGYAPLMVAAENNFYDLAGLLIQHGADVNAAHQGNGIYIALRGWTPLVFSVNAGLVRMTKRLLQAGADPHYRVPVGVKWDGTELPERGLLEFATGKRAESLTKLLRDQGVKD